MSVRSALSQLTEGGEPPLAAGANRSGAGPKGQDAEKVTLLPPIKRVLSKLPSESGRSTGTAYSGKTGGTKGAKGRSKRGGSRGSASDIASNLRSLTRKTLSDGSDSYSDTSHNNDDRKRVRDEVISVYQKVLGRKPDPAGLSHYSACILDGEMKTRQLIQQLCRSAEFQMIQENDLKSVTYHQNEWVNIFHPWNAEPDEADEEVGTVRWVYNTAKANSKRWETGENEGGSLGAEVVNGTLFNSLKDHWTSVVVEHPIEAPGVHTWRIKKIMAGNSGTRARLGVLIRDCEMDMDYQGPHFANRAFFMDENGNVWNGNAFVAFGTPWFDRNSVVTLRLDREKHVLSFHVARIDSSHWQTLLSSGKATEGPCVARIPNMPDVPLFAFSQDLYAGSGFELSKFVSSEPDVQGVAMLSKINGREQALIDQMCEKEVDLDERRKARLISMSSSMGSTASSMGGSSHFGTSTAFSGSVSSLSRVGSVGGKSVGGKSLGGKSVGGKSFKIAAHIARVVSSSKPS